MRCWWAEEAEHNLVSGSASMDTMKRSAMASSMKRSAMKMKRSANDEEIGDEE